MRSTASNHTSYKVNDKMKRLPGAELEIMLVVWKTDAPVSSSYILEQLHGQRQWRLPTLMTVLNRLIDKGFLGCQKKGRNNEYYAVIPEEAYKEYEGKSVLEKLYGNSFLNLVTSLYNSKAIDKNEITKLRHFLDQLEKEESD